MNSALQGNLGILDISSRGYTTVMRSHTSRIQSMALDPLRRQLATVSDDHTIRIWELDTMQQVMINYNFLSQMTLRQILLICLLFNYLQTSTPLKK